MYQLNETHLWSQHHHELLQEAQRERLARRLRALRLKSDRETGSGRLSSVLTGFASQGVGTTLRTGGSPWNSR